MDGASGEIATGKGRRRLLIAAMVLIAGLVALAGGYHFRFSLINRLTPGAVTLTEAYASQTTGLRFDHSLWDAVVKEYVTPEGNVDYQGLVKTPERLDAYIASLTDAPFDELSRDEKLALLINAYNAFTLRLILDYWPVSSIWDIPLNERWALARWNIGSLAVSLQQIENDYLRARFREPRIHFAINCASIGCPPLRNEAYVGDRIEQQLQSQAEYVHRQDRWLRLEGELVYLTRLYYWYEGDFLQVADSCLAYAAQFNPSIADLTGEGKEKAIRWLHYDWALNGNPEK